MRKIKHLTVSVASETNNGAFYWALVYVPQGTTPGNLTVNIITGTTGMYEPNQFVMNCGVVDPEAGPIRFTSPVSRNLNDGDAIYLLVKNTNVDGPITYNAVVRYAITLNDHHITPQIQLHQICGARRCSIINTVRAGNTSPALPNMKVVEVYRCTANLYNELGTGVPR